MNHDLERWDVRKRAVESEDGIVAAQHYLAAQAGAAMLHAGGNAVDAAVACAFALNVVEPWMCGLGGSGYLVVWLAETGDAHVIDFQGVLADGIDHADYPLDPDVPESLMGFPGVAGNRNVQGYGLITVPGAVAGLSEGLARFGRLGLDTVLGPTIALADRGLPVDWFTTLQVALEMDKLSDDPAATAVYLPEGRPLLPETYRPLGNLAATLRALAENGPRQFMRAPSPNASSRTCRRAEAGSAWTIWSAMRPLSARPCRASTGATLHTAGESSGGVRLLEALEHVAQNLDLAQGIGPHTYVTYAEALNKAFHNHKRRIGRIQEAGCTSHMSAIDRDGNIVALTYTLLNRFGAGVMLPQTGMLINNAVSYFDPQPGFPTSMEGKKRINASNMCPTVAVKDGKPLFAVGASGANHIVPCTMQITALLLDYGIGLEDAFNTPRIDAGDRETVRVDPATGPAVIADMARHFELEIAQQIVFPKLYSYPSGVLHDAASGLNFGMGDKSSPAAAAAAAGPFVLDDGGGTPGASRC